MGDEDEGPAAVVVLKSCPNATRPIMSSLRVGWGERSRVKRDVGKQTVGRMGRTNGSRLASSVR